MAFEALRDRELFRSFKLLQFSNDPIVAKGWFASVQTINNGPARGAPNPMGTEYPDGDFDCIVSSHIITRVPDHEAAVGELARLLSRRGICYLAYPNPITRATTEDWGAPRRDQNGNYRILGRDFESVLSGLLPKMHIAAVSGVDPVTQEKDLFYLLAHDFTWVRRILASGTEFRLL